MPAINRTLPVAEIAKLLKEKDARAADKHVAAVRKWPGDANLLTLAKAVHQRNKYVIFEGNKKFEIRYDSKFDAVFIKPVDNGFVPCGYINFKRLKEVLADADV